MDIALRAVALFYFVFLLTRVIGRRELSSLQPFDLTLLIVLGDSIQQGLTQDDYSVTGAVIAVSTIAALQGGLTRSPRSRTSGGRSSSPAERSASSRSSSLAACPAT
jgi:uncharacterized membrane protein YcaP (DUF421 family)